MAILITVWLTAGLSYWIDKTWRGGGSIRNIGLIGVMIGLVFCLVAGPIPIIWEVFSGK